MGRLPVFAITFGVVSTIALTGPAVASEELWIKKIVEAGLVGCDDAPESIGPRLFKNVIRLCVGKDRCTLAPVSAAKFGCTSLFVQFKCSDGSDRDVASERIGQKLTLQCE
jgi:hypothetical protein